MKVTTLATVLLLIGVGGFKFSVAGTQGLHSWHDVSRDVYVDGEADKGAQILSCSSPSRIAVLSSRLEQAALLDFASGSAKTAPKSAFRLAADHNSAASDAALSLHSAGKYTAVDSTTFVFSVEGKWILLRQHTGLTGEMSEERLYEVAPVWRRLMETYEPKSDALSTLKAADQETDVTVLFGTWCPDSKNYVPRLIKTLHEAGNEKLKLKLIGIDSAFRQPLPTVQSRRIVNVPTVIVERGGREIGRIVETPAGESIEGDLAAILNGTPNVHKGRLERGAEIAHGVYVYQDRSGARCGGETWEIFNTSDGGCLIHSQITSGDLETEVFQQVNAVKKTTFVEITKRRGDEVNRARYNIDDHTLTVRLRGNSVGVVQQTLEEPARMIFSSPAIAALGKSWPDGQITSSPTYRAQMEMDSIAGILEKGAYERRADEVVRVAAGEFQANHVVRRVGSETSESWLHPKLSVPVKGRVSGGIEYSLTSLEVAGANK